MLSIIGMLAGAFTLAAALVSVPAGAQTLGFAEARQIVLGRYEGLKALTEEQAAAREAVRQASAYSNPEIEIQTEDLGRTEVEIVLTQLIPIGGKRAAAIDVARRQAEIADLRLKSGRISVETELVRRFVPILGTHRRLELVDSLLEVSSSGIQAIRRLVEAGAAMEVDMVRAELDRDELLLQRTELERSLAEVRLELEELLGRTLPGLGGVRGVLAGTPELPALEELTAAAEHHPGSQVLDIQRLLIEAEIDEAQSEVSPELALNVGYLRNNEVEEDALIAGVSLSLPIFNRNKGAVGQKRRELAASEHHSARDRLERSTALAVLYSQFEGTGRKLSTLSGDVLSKAMLIHGALETFYAQGKTGILDLLEARRHLIELRMRIVDLTEQQALLAADIMEITGYEIEIIR
jgi:cobalt-zinc-cadmium efflux system outer membrane protein